MIVKQVQFAIQLLEYFAQRRTPATLSEIADHFGWPRSSTFNLIDTLSHTGLLYEPRYRGGYYPSRKLLKLAHAIVADGPLSERLRTCVTNIANKTDETAALCALSGIQTVLVEVVEASSPIRYFAQVGQRVPTYATSAGRALLSLLSPRERTAILRRTEYERYASDTLMTLEAVEQDIEMSKERGWFLNNNGYEPDLIGVAIPMPLEERQFCLLVAGPAYRTENRIAELAQLLQEEIAEYMRERGEHD